MEDRRGGVSGNETLACFAVSGRHSASGGFVKNFVCETLLEAGFASSSFPPWACSERGWREGAQMGREMRRAKKRRTGRQSTESRRAAVVRRDGSQALSR